MGWKERQVDYSRLPGWAKLLFWVGFANWFAFAAVHLFLGGTALGTEPSDGRFYVETKSVERSVSEPVWWLNLAYSYVSLLLPLAGLLCCLPFASRVTYKRTGRPAFPPGAGPALFVVVLVFTIVWAGVTTRELVIALAAYARMA